MSISFIHGHIVTMKLHNESSSAGGDGSDRRLINWLEKEWGESGDTPLPPRCARVTAGVNQEIQLYPRITYSALRV